MELNIPDGFLEGEIRSGFYVEKMMKRNWACMIKALAEIDRICAKYGIKYFADWGTLLGAVRHKGFIPWDDDIDISMLRPDYERFLAAASYELPEGWEILNMYNEKDWRATFSHLVTGRSVRFDKEHMDEYYGFPYVAGIDIFQYDYTAPTEEEDKYVRYVVKIVRNAIREYQSETKDAQEKEDLLASIEQMCRVSIDRNGDVVNQMYRLYDSLSQMYSSEESSCVALMPDYPNIKKEFFDNMVQLDFEYIKVPAPAEYETLLEIQFGKDWRTPVIAPEHVYPYYKTQRYATWKEG
jgi:lipopolysaccharide cholinephosphotransferase